MKLPNELQHYYIKLILIVVGVLALAILFGFLFYFAIDVILLFFAAILLAICFHSLGYWVCRYTNLPEKFSVTLVALLIFGLLGLGIWLLAPSISDQIGSLRTVLPQTFDSLRAQLGQYNWGRLIIEQIPPWEEIIDTLTDGSFLRRIGGFFSTTIGAVTKILIVILLAIYLATEPQTYIKGFVKLFPRNKRKRVREVIGEIGTTLRWWLVGRFVDMLFIGVLTTIGLYFLDIELALSLGLLAAFTTFIPNFGPIISVIPALLVAFVDSPTKALYVAILYFFIETIESYIATPLIDRQTISLPPVLTIFFQLLLGFLIGALGLILATPLLAVIIIVIQMVYIEDVLGDSVVKLSEGEDDEENSDNRAQIIEHEKT